MFAASSTGAALPRQHRHHPLQPPVITAAMVMGTSDSQKKQ